MYLKHSLSQHLLRSNPAAFPNLIHKKKNLTTIVIRFFSFYLSTVLIPYYETLAERHRLARGDQ